MISLAFAHLRASAVSLPSRMAVVLHSSDVFVIAKTRHQQMYTDVHLLMRYLPLIFAKAPFSPIIYSSVSYGGLACRHRAFRSYLFVFPAHFPQCFSSRRRLLLFFLKDKKDTASIAVRGNFSYTCTHLSHTAVTSYERDSSSLIASHIIAYKRLCFISIFLLLFLWRLFSLPIIQIYFL